MFELDPWNLLTFVLLGVITVVTRGFFFMSSKPWTLPHWAQRGLQYAPIAALAAVVMPEVVTTQGVLVQTWMDARLFAAAAERHLAGGGAALLATHIDLGLPNARTLDLTPFKATTAAVSNAFDEAFL